MPTTINSAGITFNDATSLTSAVIPANAVGATQLANGSVTAAKLGTTEQTRIAKAWVNFNGTNTLFTSQSYSQTGNVLTIGTSGFGVGGLSVGQTAVIASVASGALTTGTIITVTAINSGTGVVTFSSPVSLNTSGTCSWNTNMIRSSYNVSSVTKSATGRYIVNFTTAMTDTNYSVVMGTSCRIGSVIGIVLLEDTVNSSRTTSLLPLTSLNLGSTYEDTSISQVAVFEN